MLERNQASWNNIVSGSDGAGLFAEGFLCLEKCWSKDLISACNKSDSWLLEGIQIHGFAEKAGFLADGFASSALLHFYGTYGYMTTARKFFEEMPDRNVVSWTSLMIDYSNNGDPEEAIEIYCKMKGAGVSCGANSFAHVMVSGSGSNVSVANTLINMF
ncbi:hypothetical protein MKW92_031629, partial [Papaver armeniacum]